jgi:predicted urease superfamily metal-dependent hydrolase
MAKKAKRATRKGPKLSGTQAGRLRNLLEKALLDAQFRRRLLANPRKVLAEHRIGLTPAQVRRFEKAKNAILAKARQLEKRAVEAARSLAKQASVMSFPQIR